MAIEEKHPEFVERLGEWLQLTDTYTGERAVKAKRLDYLPATEGMVQDGMNSPQAPGWKDYEAYLMRAVYHDVVKDAVKAMIGVMHAKPAVITLPKRMEGMRTNATVQGEGLQSLLRKINVAQLLKGRCGLLVDVPKGVPVNKALPYLTLYNAEQIINWDAGRLDEGSNVLEMVVLDESGYRREGFKWKTEKKFRVLSRTTGATEVDTFGRPLEGYAVAVKINETNDPVPADFLFPSIGGQILSDIPFVFIGANDLVPEPEIPPLLGLSNLALAIYRAEADYRQTLYLQGQNTLVIIGGNVEETEGGGKLRVGNKGIIDLKLDGDAKYIGVSAEGLGEMRQSLESDKARAGVEGAQFLDVSSDTGQSGEALRVRVAARVTTVASVARTSGAGLEAALKHAAIWLGEDPSEVSVEPTTDFADQTVAGAALLAFMQAKQLGLPLSLRSMHRMMRINDMTEMNFEEENAQIEEEAASMLGTMVSPFAGATDDTFLDDNVDPVASPGAGTPPAAPTPGQPPAAPASTVPPNKNVPVTPSAGNKGYTRGSPVPLKTKVGKKGASAGKTKNGQ